MKTKHLLINTLILLSIGIGACAGQPTSIPTTPATESPANTDTSPTEAASGTVEDYDSLVNALQAAGATAEPGDNIEQPFFAVMGRIVKVNGADVQVFEYDSAEAMEADAAQVSEDGGSIGTTMATWMDAPHFYKAGQLIVLYVGQDQTILDLLEGVLGPQFAGG